MTTSYPYLKIAREFGVDYGDVLWMAHIIENPGVVNYNYYSCAIISPYLRQLHNRTMRLTSLSLLPGAKLACCGVVINRAMQRKSRRDDRRDRQA